MLVSLVVISVEFDKVDYDLIPAIIIGEGLTHIMSELIPELDYTDGDKPKKSFNLNSPFNILIINK